MSETTDLFVKPKRNMLSMQESFALLRWLEKNKSAPELKGVGFPRVAEAAAAALSFDVTTANVSGVCEAAGFGDHFKTRGGSQEDVLREMVLAQSRLLKLIVESAMGEPPEAVKLAFDAIVEIERRI